MGLNPLHYRAYIEATLLCLRLKNYTDALNYGEESLIHAPTNSREILGYTYYLIARVYEKNDQLDKANEHINKAKQSDYKVKYLYEESRLLGKMGKVQEAMKILMKSIQRDPQYFAQALVDPAFYACYKELEQTLTNLKRPYEEEANHKISIIRNTMIPQYNVRKNRAELGDSVPTNVSRESTRANIRPVDKRGGLRFNYNRIASEFEEHYTELTNNYNHELKRMEGYLKNQHMWPILRYFLN